MPTSKAKLAGNKRHVEKLDNLMVRPYKEEGEMIRKAAADAGETVQAYILKAIRMRMESEK